MTHPAEIPWDEVLKAIEDPDERAFLSVLHAKYPELWVSSDKRQGFILHGIALRSELRSG
jgi:hypothetical protein